MSDCIFCKLANGEIPTPKLYEDESFAVILDAAPASKGHALILPKAHYADIREMPEELCAKAFVLAKKIGTRMETAMGADGFNIVQNNSEAAGQTVFHFHIHIIPRTLGEQRIVANWKQGALTEESRQEILDAFAAAGK